MVSTTILLACRGTDSLTTPSDTTPEASAQVVADACDEAVATDYLDLHVTTVGKFEDTGVMDESFELKFDVAGKDFQFDFQGNMRSGQLHHQGILVNGVGYYQKENDTWQVDHTITAEYLQRFFNITTADGGQSVCPNITKMEKVGVEMLDGVERTVYKIETALNFLPEPEKYIVNIRTDFLVDAAGQLVQLRTVESHPATDERGSGTVTTIVTISGIGEPNTITAPAIP